MKSMQSAIFKVRNSLAASQNISRRGAFWILITVQVLYFSPIVIRQWVIIPNNNSDLRQAQLGCNPLIPTLYGDSDRQFIPNIYFQLHSDSKAWIPAWVPNVEFGKPFVDGWTSRSFLVMNLLAWFTSDALWLFTIYIVLIFVLGGIFCFLYLKELGLSPWACLIAALLYCFSPFNINWQTFPLFLTSGTWLFGFLWGLKKFVSQPGWRWGVLLSFFTYCALYTMYPQNVIYLLYILAAYTLYLIFSTARENSSRLKLLLLLGLSVSSGMAAYLPSFLDLLEVSKVSVRERGVDDQWLLANLHGPLASIQDVALGIQIYFDSYWLGPLHEPAQPGLSPIAFGYQGLSVTPVAGVLFLLAFRPKTVRKIWGWLILILLANVATFVPQVYLFMVHYLGFGLSRSTPLMWATLAVWIVIGSVLDEIVTEKWKLSPLNAILLGGLALNSALVYLFYRQYLSLNHVYFSLAIFTGMLIFFRYRLLAMVFVMALTSIYVYGFRLMLWRDVSCFAVDSPIIAKIKEYIQDGQRFAWVGNVPGRFFPNQEILFGLASIHSYNSISSQAYSDLIKSLSGSEPAVYGRSFISFPDPGNLGDPSFFLTDVRLLVSGLELPAGFELIDIDSQVYFYRPRYKSIPSLQTPEYQLTNAKEVVIPLDDKAMVSVPSVVMKKDDYLALALAPSSIETLLFVSQQYHPNWIARNGFGQRLATVRVNGFYQGVLIPPKTTAVSLEYAAWVYYSFLPQLIYMIFGMTWLLSRVTSGKSDIRY